MEPNATFTPEGPECITGSLLVDSTIELIKSGNDPTDNLSKMCPIQLGCITAYAPRIVGVHLARQINEGRLTALSVRKCSISYRKCTEVYVGIVHSTQCSR